MLPKSETFSPHQNLVGIATRLDRVYRFRSQMNQGQLNQKFREFCFRKHRFPRH